MPPRSGRSAATGERATDTPIRVRVGSGRGRSKRPSAATEAAHEPRDDRRKQILKAAVKVFAEKGYHGCRISDVAEEAGVAYGLVYHYYGNKDGLLAAVFDTNWGVFAKAVADVAEAPGIGMYEKLRQIVELAFQAFEMFPLVVKVLVLEFGRNARLGEALDNPAVTGVFRSVARIFQDGRKSGELYEGIDPLAMSVIFLGTLETAFVSFVLTHQGARSKMQAGITLDQMKATVLAMIQRALLGNLHRVERDSRDRPGS
jgi:TetR/AcrR family fatty acid metabolism transcriptional regulator